MLARPTFLYSPKHPNSYSINQFYRLPYKVEKIDISKNVQKEPYVPLSLSLSLLPRSIPLILLPPHKKANQTTPTAGSSK